MEQNAYRLASPGASTYMKVWIVFTVNPKPFRSVIAGNGTCTLTCVPCLCRGEGIRGPPHH